MAFLLRDIPGSVIFDRFARRYPELDPTATEAFLRLMRIGSDYLDFLDKLLEPHGLLHGRWITLILLMREPDRTARPSVLAEKQGVSRPTMSGLLEGLNHDGLVECLDDPEDGRRSQVKLTSKGIRKLDQIMPGYYAAVSQLMQDYNSRELNQLLKLLRKAPEPS